MALWVEKGGELAFRRHLFPGPDNSTFKGRLKKLP